MREKYLDIMGRIIISVNIIFAILISLSMIRTSTSLAIVVSPQTIMRNFYVEDLLTLFESIMMTPENSWNLEQLLLYPNFNFRYYYEKIVLSPEILKFMSEQALLNDSKKLLPIGLLQRTDGITEWLLENLDTLKFIQLCDRKMKLHKFTIRLQPMILNYILAHQTSSRISDVWCSQVNNLEVFLQGDLWQLFDAHCYRRIKNIQSRSLPKVIEHIGGLAKKGNVLAKIRLAMLAGLGRMGIDAGEHLVSEDKKFGDALKAILGNKHGQRLSQIEASNIVRSVIEALQIEKETKAAFLFELLACILGKLGSQSEPLKDPIQNLFDSYEPDVVSPYAIRVVLFAMPDSLLPTFNTQWSAFIEREWLKLELPEKLLDFDKRASLWRSNCLRITWRTRPNRRTDSHLLMFTNRKGLDKSIARAQSVVDSNRVVLDSQGVKYHCNDKGTTKQIEHFWRGRVVDFALNGVFLPSIPKIQFRLIEDLPINPNNYCIDGASNTEILREIMRLHSGICNIFSIRRYKLF